MRGLFVAGVIALASSSFTSSAQAAVEYKLSGFDAAAGQFSFDFVSPTFLTADRAFIVNLTGAETNCVIAGASACQSVQFLNNGLRGNNVTIATVSGASYIFPFRAPAFTSYGTSSTLLGGSTGTLTVSQVAAPVPEPATWGMMTLGVGALGFAMRRRRKVAGAAGLA